MALVNLKFRLVRDSRELGEVRMGSVIPRIGETVALQSQLRHGGQASYRVADVLHYYTDNNARSFDQYVPGVVWIILEEIPQA